MGTLFAPELDGLGRELMARAKAAPILSRELEASLIRDWQDNCSRRSLDRLTTAYMRLVIAQARKFRHYGLNASDLIQEGLIGLMEAANRFELERNLRFSTYACWWVRAAMQDYILRNWSIVRTGTTAAHKSLFFNMRRLKARYGDLGDGTLTPDIRNRIATELRVRDEDVLLMEGRLSGNDRSLNSVIGENGDMEWQDTLADDRDTPDVVTETEFDTSRRNAVLTKALNALSPRELVIISARQLADEPKTLSDLGDELGISKERVRQIEASALAKLKTSLTPHVGLELG